MKPSRAVPAKQRALVKPAKPPKAMRATKAAPNKAEPKKAAAPAAWMVALEVRAPWELAALVACLPWLSQLPRGDGHPVIVYPGLGVADFSTVPLRRVLQYLGYQTYAWEQGLNFGPRHGVLDACRQQLRDITKLHGTTASLIGWSLGGLYARELAKDEPQAVRSVITLGTPFTGHPHATHAWRLFELVSGQSASNPKLRARLAQAPSCPTTSIYSRTDGVVAWPCSINPEQAHTENIEVQASHVGMGMNPLALYAIADRLRQRPGHWKKFGVEGMKRWFFGARPGAKVTSAASI